MKKAVLIVSFGSSNLEAYKQIEAFIKNIKKSIDNEIFVQCVFTSNILIKRMKEKNNIEILNINDALEKLFKHFVDLLNGCANEKISALIAGAAASDKCRVVAAVLRLLGGKVTERAARELNEEGLLCKAARTHLVTVVEEELVGVGRESNVTDTENVYLNGVKIESLLSLVSRGRTAVDKHICVILVVYSVGLAV